MPTGYTRSPKLLKGALVELSEPFLGPVPNIIIFQYNPETMSRELTPWSAEVEERKATEEDIPLIESLGMKGVIEVTVPAKEKNP